MRRLSVAALVLLLFAALIVVVTPSKHAVAGASTTNLSTAQLASVGAPPCQANWTCVPVPCKSGISCGVIEAGPTSNLGPDQWVYLNFYGFKPDTSIFLYYCQDLGSLSKPPICPLSGTQLQPDPTAIIQTLKNGTAAYSYQVVQAQPPQALEGQIPGDAFGTPIPFYCDTSGANCAIDAVIPSLAKPVTQIPNANNTTVIPVSFSTAGGQCSSAKQVTSESEYGFDELFSATDAATCAAKGSGATIPFNTAVDGLGALQDLSKGGIAVAFTDDPQALSQQAIESKDHFLFIPIALSANVVANHAETVGTESVYPQTAIKLTANMVAGLMTGAYSQPSNADLAPCGTSTCPMMEFINYIDGFNGAQNNYSSFVRSDAAGTTDQMFSWICASPAMALHVALTPTYVVNATETATGEQILKQGLYAGGGAPSGCVNTDQFPPIDSVNGSWGAFNTPDQQSLKLNAFVQPPGVASTPTSGFAPMNWAIGSYYGMNFAQIQNAAGDFVGPSAQSIDAGISDGTWNNTGMWTPSYTNTSDPAAYAMPTVMYAAVSRSSSISASQKSALQAALSQVLATTTNQSANLPGGLLPLTPAIATMSENEVANGIGNPAYVATPPGGSTTPPANNGSGSYSYSGTRFGSTFGSLSALRTLALLHAANGAAGSGSTSIAPTPSSSPTYGPFSLTASESKLILPLTVSGGALLFLLGLGMIAASLLGKRASGALLEAEDGSVVEPESPEPPS